MTLRVPTGIDDFRKLRELDLVYVDKSDLIRGLVDDAGTEVALLPRPRRFGKSLNLSMLRWFFEKRDEDLSHLFEDLAIWRAGDAYRAHFQRYPVIHLSLKGTGAQHAKRCRERVHERLRALYREHLDVFEGDAIDDIERARFRSVLDGSAEDVAYERALFDLSSYLHRHHGARVVILIDEYDEPIHAAYLNGYAGEVLDFFRAFLGEGLKGNPHLYKAVLTGILRVARESIFSGLNNLRVYSLLSPKLAAAFGFTEAEVEDLLARTGLHDRLSEVRAWYDGYVFGGHVMYNPWSVLCFVDEARIGVPPQPYWLSTSANLLIKRVLEARAHALQPEFEALLAGDGVDKPVDEAVALDDLTGSDRALWSLLVFSGYLKAEALAEQCGPRIVYRLAIPNQEVRLVYTDTFYGWLEARMRGHGADLDVLTSALLRGDAAVFEEQLQALALNLLSYHDPGRSSPESLYHGFLIGLLAVLEPGHRVRSNRESGHGRPDVMIAPVEPGRPGVLLELKVARPGRKTLDEALAEGLTQITQKGYDAELRALGAAPIHALAVAFDGKQVRVRAPSPSPLGDTP
ncbi:AAA family ATPase [Haliangium sp.]|uniref:AAA family ATPase n=1 Tax=Haliangium sp. TaxID=2663208 RepID=UPI003D0E0EF3